MRSKMARRDRQRIQRETQAQLYRQKQMELTEFQMQKAGELQEMQRVHNQKLTESWTKVEELEKKLGENWGNCDPKKKNMVTQSCPASKHTWKTPRSVHWSNKKRGV